MAIFYSQSFLSVSDYMKPDMEIREAFDLCEADLEAAQLAFEQELQAANHIATIKSVEFLEFDSGNSTHANAYFQVEYESESQFDLD